MFARPRVKTAFFIGTLLALSLASGGCKLASYKPKSLWPMDIATQPQQPAKVAAIWSDNVLYTAGQAPTRGFGGRIYFYDARSDAIKVDGQLIVYVYDDDAPGAGDRPTRRFVFSAEQLAQHYSGSELGPSYSVWIPWDNSGGPTKQLSLVPFFLPCEGGLIAGEHTRHRLPGTDQDETKLDRKELATQPHRAENTSAVRQISYEANLVQKNLARPPEPTTGMRTTTINIPVATRDRLAHSQTIPRAERTHVATRTGDASETRWDHYDRAQFSALRAAEYRSERFNRQRAAPWEQRAPADPNPQSQSNSLPQESAAEWAARYRQRNPFPQAAEQTPPAQPNQPEVRYGHPSPPAPAGLFGRSSLDRAPSQPGRAGWQSDSPLRPSLHPEHPSSAASSGAVTYGR